MDLAARAQKAVAAVPRDLLASTAAFLLWRDSKSNYAIEGERPAPDNWGRPYRDASRQPLSAAELLRLQAIVIGDARLVSLGLREEVGFVGEHDLDSRLSLPLHISARTRDIAELIDGMIAFDHGAARAIDAVIAAAVLAFGFVYAHAFVDGNGRLHRYLIHHVLAGRGFNPAGVIFPVSSTILDDIEAYQKALEDYSKRLLPVIQWEVPRRPPEIDHLCSNRLDQITNRSCRVALRRAGPSSSMPRTRVSLNRFRAEPDLMEWL